MTTKQMSRAPLFMACAVVFAVCATPDAHACCSDDTSAGYYLRIPAAPYALSALHTVVTPDFAPRHLALLYRTASGVPVTALELGALQRAWARDYGRLDGASEALIAQAAWEQAATKVLGKKATSRTDVMAEVADTSLYLRIHADAYRRALSRLQLRRQRYAQAPELLAAWTASQSKVLGVEFDAPTTMPASIPPQFAANVAEDAQWLSALDAFYAGRHDDAVKAFDSLTSGDDAPWAGINAARARLRQATLDSTTPQQRAAHFADAERRLLAVTSKDEQIAGAAQSLLLLTLRERGALCEALPSLMRRRLGGALPHLLEAFESTAPRIVDDSDGVSAEGDVATVCAAVPALRDWTSVFQQLVVPGWNTAVVVAGAAAAKKRAVAQWTKTPTKPWLIAALTGADGSEPELPALLSAARAIAPGEVVGPTVALHEVRLLRLSGRRAEAHARLAQLPTQKWSTSAQNFFELERFLLADTAAEAMAYVWPMKAANRDTNTIASDRVDKDVALRVANASLDATTMVSLSSLTALPMSVRQALAWSGFVRRSVVGGDVKAAASAVMAVDARAAELSAVRDAVDDPGARGLALRAAMQHPGASADVLFVDDRAIGAIATTDHWRNGCEDPRNGWFPGVRGAPATWATPAASTEQAAIAGGSGAVYARAAMAFARANPTHALSPELLHLAVRHSRYMSGGADTKAAFTLLHQQWPSSTWTEQTPVYW